MAATPAEGVSLEELETLFEAEIQKVIEAGVTDEEVNDAVQRLQDSAIYARDSIAGPAMIVGRALTTGSTLDDVENWPDDIARISAGQIQAAAEKYLSPEAPWIRPPVTGYLLPEGASE